MLHKLAYIHHATRTVYTHHTTRTAHTHHATSISLQNRKSRTRNTSSNSLCKISDDDTLSASSKKSRSCGKMDDHNSTKSSTALLHSMTNPNIPPINLQQWQVSTQPSSEYVNIPGLHICRRPKSWRSQMTVAVLHTNTQIVSVIQLTSAYCKLFVWPGLKTIFVWILFPSNRHLTKLRELLHTRHHKMVIGP